MVCGFALSHTSNSSQLSASRHVAAVEGLRNAWLLVQQRCTALRSRFIRVLGPGELTLAVPF